MSETMVSIEKPTIAGLIDSPNPSSTTLGKH